MALAFEALKFAELKFEEPKRASQAVETPLPFHQLSEPLEKVATLLSESQTSPLDLETLTKHTQQALSLACDLFNDHRDRDSEDSEDVVFWVTALHKTAAQHNDDHKHNTLANAYVERLQQLACKARRLALSMDFAFLLNPERQLLSIGFSLDDVSLDTSCYDLLSTSGQPVCHRQR